jgi:hypothetical protein
MPVYNVFTWNMQRARSVSQWNRPLAHAVTQQEKTIRERYRVLQTLVNWADFGFITEPGMDIRQNLNNFNLPGLNRHFCASLLADNQTDASACRPVIYSKIPFSRIPPTTESYISYLSGAAEAYRYPAAGIVTLAQGDGQGNNELLLLSFHATSGYNANENCRGYFDSFYQNDYLQRAIPLVWIVGGDFNCNAGRGVYMPATSTHQSDHVLDGFFADQNGTNFQVTAVTAPQTYGQLITNNLLDPHGFVVNGCHLSDHCPVCAQLQIERFSWGVDTANIVTGARTRRKSVRYMDVDMS